MSGPHPAAPPGPPPAQAAADPNHEPGLSECGCRMCDPQRHGPPAPPAATPGQAAHEARERSRWARHGMASGDPLPIPWEDLTDDQRADWDAAAAAVMLHAQAAVDYAELQQLREKLAATQAIARMLQATAREILAAYESGTVVSGELAGIWRARLGGDHA